MAPSRPVTIPHPNVPRNLPGPESHTGSWFPGDDCALMSYHEPDSWTFEQGLRQRRAAYRGRAGFSIIKWANAVPNDCRHLAKTIERVWDEEIVVSSREMRARELEKRMPGCGRVQERVRQRVSMERGKGWPSCNPWDEVWWPKVVPVRDDRAAEEIGVCTSAEDTWWL